MTFHNASGLRATKLNEVESRGARWTTFADVEGNEFDLIAVRVADVAAPGSMARAGPMLPSSVGQPAEQRRAGDDLDVNAVFGWAGIALDPAMAPWSAIARTAAPHRSAPSISPGRRRAWCRICCSMPSQRVRSRSAPGVFSGGPRVPQHATAHRARAAGDREIWSCLRAKEPEPSGCRTGKHGARAQARPRPRSVRSAQVLPPYAARRLPGVRRAHLRQQHRSRQRRDVRARETALSEGDVAAADPAGPGCGRTCPGAATPRSAGAPEPRAGRPTRTGPMELVELCGFSRSNRSVYLRQIKGRLQWAPPMRPTGRSPQRGPASSSGAARGHSRRRPALHCPARSPPPPHSSRRHAIEGRGRPVPCSPGPPGAQSGAGTMRGPRGRAEFDRQDRYA
jgi:hypothetical protein